MHAALLQSMLMGLLHDSTCVPVVLLQGRAVSRLEAVASEQKSLRNRAGSLMKSTPSRQAIALEAYVLSTSNSEHRITLHDRPSLIVDACVEL